MPKTYKRPPSAGISLSLPLGLIGQIDEEAVKHSIKRSQMVENLIRRGLAAVLQDEEVERIRQIALELDMKDLESKKVEVLDTNPA